MGGIAHAPAMGSTVKSNDAGSKIRIYDLRTGELISENSTSGIAKINMSEGDKGSRYLSSSGNIALRSLEKLIKQYRKKRDYELSKIFSVCIWK